MKTRDSYFDNAKFLLIILVVFGHLIRSFIDNNEVMLHIYKFIYTFHMPAFILVSGYFAKGFRKKGYVGKIAKKLIIPYLIFQGIYSVYYVLIQKQDQLELNPLDPQWSLWFLLSLFFWNLMLFVFTKTNWKIALTLSFLLGIGIGYADFANSFLSMGRTFVFFPLFLIGFYMKREHFYKLTSFKGRVLSILFLAFTFSMYFFWQFDFEWLFGSKPYSAFGQAVAVSALIRSAFYGLTVATTLSFLAIVPQREAFFTTWGTRTFYVYLLHGFIINGIRNSPAESWLNDYQSITIYAAAAIIVTFLLSSNLIKTLTEPIVELKATRLKRKLKSIQQT
ncbi:acyltransferase family protein [Bacillus sp. FJAT-42376]|uniref:acyltransferase family protein n=1 Tax=Bacillus sp. FJAT-42376 TaxID=2014076 RepID=UPI000F513870|nr:acyltransferase family protein [Bacillus sp. FJAT-42376]AZB42523.1 acyltransferase family protein [Bacillus sp. FJAT-42376]